MAEQINLLKELNPDIEFYSIHSDEFKKYGAVIDIDAKEMIDACENIKLPEAGSLYTASVPELEKLKVSDELRKKLFGGCDAQVGLCCGYNNFLNAFEYHNSSEINVAITPLVLILGLRYDMVENEYDSSKAKAFYLEKGDVVEVFGTTLHFCPCQTSDEGFMCGVVLPKGTNTELEGENYDKILFKKNKWIICHDKNDALIERGVYPGIHGINYQIKY
jgi:hypothetical protein